MKYKILIIDDDRKGRNNIYSSFFEKSFKGFSDCPCFEIKYLDHPRTMEENIKTINADAIFIDAVLNDDLVWKSVKIETVLDKIKAAYRNSIPPIFLISGFWNVDLIGTVNDAFAESLPNVLPKKYYTYRAIADLVAEAHHNDMVTGKANCIELIKERNKIHKIIATHYSRTDKKLFCNDEITILHISDLQYGDKKTTANFIGIFEEMMNSLKKNSIKNIDLIVVSGDIAMSGKEQEYKEAMQIKALFKKFWPNEETDFSDRIIFAPGNHDFDINFCLLNYFNAKNLPDKREIDLLHIIKSLLDEKNTNGLSYNKYGTSAFRKFCYDITHNQIYIDKENLNFVIDDFLDWGIRFIVLNSTSKINIKETNRVEFFGDEINDIVQRVNESPYGDKIFNVVISHHTELFLEKSTDTNNSIQIFNQLKNSLGCKLFLGGHRHINDKKDGKTSNDEKYTVIEASTLRVDENDADHQRGFNVLQLRKSDGYINSVIEHQFVFNKADGAISLKQTKEHSFC